MKEVNVVLNQWVIADLAEVYLRALDCPRSLTVWLLYSYGEHQQLVDLTFNPAHYETPHEGAMSCLATEFFSKYDKLNTGVNPKEVAFTKGIEAEIQNARTNERISRDLSGLFPISETESASLLFSARKIIARVLGPVPSDLHSFRKWGPGRTTVTKHPWVSPLDKFGVTPDVTAPAFTLAMRMVNELPHWASAILNSDGLACIVPRIGAVAISEGNVAITVPKNAKTDRLISYEPHLNSALQLSCGAYIRRRLQRFGIDLSDQSMNGRLALEGSLSGMLATIDLSMASDTLAYETVKALLPEDWFHYLDRIRSRYTTWPHGIMRNEKFASMGNGFTFELETLVFYSLCKAIDPSLQPGVNFAVYGDDIIVPTHLYNSLERLLRYCGFNVNTKKTYASTFFRESCGVYAFGGQHLVVPRLRPQRKLKDQVRIVRNQIVRMFSSWFGHVPRQLWDELNQITEPFGFPYGPDEAGDGHLIAPFDFVKPQRDRRGWDGYEYKSYKRRPSRPKPSILDERKPFAVLASGLYTNERSSLASLLETVQKDVVYSDRTIRSFCSHEWKGFLVI